MTIAYVGSAIAPLKATGSTNHVVTGVSVAVGSLMLVTATADPSGGAVSSLVDDGGNTYTLVGSVTTGSGSTGVTNELWKCVLTTGLLSTDAVGVTWSASSGARVVAIDWFSGATATEDVTAQTLSSSSSSPSISITPTTAGCLVFVSHGIETSGVVCTTTGFTTANEDVTSGAGGALTNIESSTHYKIETAAAAATWNPSLGGALNSAVVMAAFRPAGGGGGISIPVVMHQRRMIGAA